MPSCACSASSLGVSRRSSKRPYDQRSTLVEKLARLPRERTPELHAVDLSRREEQHPERLRLLRGRRSGERLRERVALQRHGEAHPRARARRLLRYDGGLRRFEVMRLDRRDRPGRHLLDLGRRERAFLDEVAAEPELVAATARLDEVDLAFAEGGAHLELIALADEDAGLILRLEELEDRADRNDTEIAGEERSCSPARCRRAGPSARRSTPSTAVRRSAPVRFGDDAISGRSAIAFAAMSASFRATTSCAMCGYRDA